MPGLRRVARDPQLHLLGAHSQRRQQQGMTPLQALFNRPMLLLLSRLSLYLVAMSTLCGQEGLSSRSSRLRPRTGHRSPPALIECALTIGSMDRCELPHHVPAPLGVHCVYPLVLGRVWAFRFPIPTHPTHVSNAPVALAYALPTVANLADCLRHHCGGRVAQPPPIRMLGSA